MNKKLLVTILGAAFAIAIYWLGFVNGMYYSESKDETIEETIDETVVIVTISDEEVMRYAILEEHGEGYYGVLNDDDNDEFIDCLIYSHDGVLRFDSSFSRTYYRDHYVDILLTNH